MAPTAPVQQKKITWSETNKLRKEERKNYREKQLLKGLKHSKLEHALKEQQVENEKQLNEVSTISIAVPGSIMDNAQSAELRTYLAGQIARAACIFQIDEIIVFDDYNYKIDNRKVITDAEGNKVASRSCAQLGRILQYLECPQYLRKFFFPIHKDLKYAGLLNPLDAPHHLRENNTFAFREGVVSERPVKNENSSWVNVGLKNECLVEKRIMAGIRCTVKLDKTTEGGKKLKGSVVSPVAPRQETGVYWGYTVRIANSLSHVFTKCPYAKGYDLTVGTSDKGDTVDEYKSPEFHHLLIVFGGLEGLETALECDEDLKVDDPSLLFDAYLNTLPEQGSRTIRTEEAVLTSLAALRSRLTRKYKPKMFTETAAIAQSSESGKDGNAIDLSRFD